MLPRISEDLDSGYGVLGVAVAIGLLAYSVGALSAGKLIDRIPGRGLLLATYAVTGIGLLLAATSTSPVTLTVATIVMGAIAPISWATSIHLAGATVEPGSRSVVMAGASSGAALGVLLNGVLVQTSSTLHTWRVSFVIAAVLALIPIIGGRLVFRASIPPPAPQRGSASYIGLRRVLVAPAGRVVVLASLAAGLGGFPFNVFLTATASDEMLLSPWLVASLWWMIGIVGTAAGPVMGRFGDRTSPLLALVVGAAAYAAGILVLLAAWGYAGLVVAVLGFGVMNYPIWGLVGAIANRSFPAEAAVRAVSIGLIAASSAGAMGNALSGAWIDATGSFRGPVALLGVVMLANTVWLASVHRRGLLEAGDVMPARPGFDPDAYHRP